MIIIIMPIQNTGMLSVSIINDRLKKFFHILEK